MPSALTATEAPTGPSALPASIAALKSPRWNALHASCTAAASAAASSFGAAFPAAVTSDPAPLLSGTGPQSPACSLRHDFVSAQPEKASAWACVVEGAPGVLGTTSDRQ